MRLYKGNGRKNGNDLNQDAPQPKNMVFLRERNELGYRMMNQFRHRWSVRRKQSVSYGDILINRTVSVGQDAHAGRGRAYIGFLVQRIPIGRSRAVEIHQIGFHLVDEDSVLRLGWFVIPWNRIIYATAQRQQQEQPQYQAKNSHSDGYFGATVRYFPMQESVVYPKTMQ